MLGRFINADGAIFGIEGELLGYNMYAYCMNNPVNMEDGDGNWPKVLGGLMIISRMIVRKIKNHRNKVKISRELKSSYTKEDAKEKIDEMLKDYNECEIAFNSEGVNISNSYQVKSRYERQKISMIVKRTGITERSVGNMSAEWVFHNIVYDVLKPFPDVFGIGDKRDSAQSAFIDSTRDGRDGVVVFTKILEIWGYE